MKAFAFEFLVVVLLRCCTSFLHRTPLVRKTLKPFFSIDPDIYNIDVKEIHPKTAETAVKHCETFNLFAANNRFAEHTISAFEEAQEFVDRYYADLHLQGPKYVIIDSGCGVGLSTYCLARLYPNIPVLGIDRSVVRLSKNKKVPLKNVAVARRATSSSSPASGVAEESHHSMSTPVVGRDGTAETEGMAFSPRTVTRASSTGTVPSNCILLRAELSDFYLLAAQQSDWVIHSHYMLYPNPYPKGKHLSRRWHGHPILPVILALGGKLVLRSNWGIYCREMVLALEAIRSSNSIPGLTFGVNFEQLDSNPAAVRPVTTHFEKKYAEAGQSLFQVTVELGDRDPQQRVQLLASIPSTSSIGAQ
jgi:tRNA G46 methylase TrmB